MTSKFLSSLKLVVLLSLVSRLAHAKSFANQRGNGASAERDPLMALPSGLSANQADHLATQAQPQVHYVVHQEPEVTPTHQQVAELSKQTYLQPRQEVSYVLVKSESGTSSNQPDTPVEEDCNQRERGEYLVAADPDQAAPGQLVSEGRQDYPGEVVYVSQNGQDRQEQQSFVSAESHRSGVPATILTEVPIRDMPYEVLEKLRREYGVKVVATRERPGANLVINCDDYTGQGQSICSKQAPISSAQAEGLPPASLLSHPSEDRAPASPQREATLIEQAGPYRTGSSEHRQVSYVTRGDGDARVAAEVAPQPEGQDYREGFGSRTTYLAVEQTEPAQPNSPDESGVEERPEVQPEGETHESSFEAQPNPSADGTELEHEKPQ